MCSAKARTSRTAPSSSTYDLPWAIIRLIQRAGRVDRIGQKADTILCYSFLPADGVERIIRLRGRVRQRLQENAEVVGTDEAFFEDDRTTRSIRRPVHREGRHPRRRRRHRSRPGLLRLPDLEERHRPRPQPGREDSATCRQWSFATRATRADREEPEGVLVYLRTAEGNDALAWVDKRGGSSVTESQFAILKAAECAPDTPALPRHDNHHDWSRRPCELIVAEEKSVGGQLGRPSGARFRTYERLKRYADESRARSSTRQKLPSAIEEIYQLSVAPDRHRHAQPPTPQRHRDEELAELVIALRDEDRLCLIHEDEDRKSPRSSAPWVCDREGS